MSCAGPNATHYDGCECREAARDRELADARLMLRAVLSSLWWPTGTKADEWVWERFDGEAWRLPRTGDTHEIDDTVREAMRASLGVR
jgi:hypothetical protein